MRDEPLPRAVATNIDNSGDQHTALQEIVVPVGIDLRVHVIPSGEVITLFVPFSETATNIDSSGDQHTVRQ
jgi:hypothetical protein